MPGSSASPATPIFVLNTIVADILKEYSEELDEINDSKKLTEKKREKLYDIIMKNFYVAVGISTVEEIDKMNIETNKKKKQIENVWKRN